MKKILFLNPVSEIGGAEKILLAWLGALNKRNSEFEIHLLLPGQGSLVALAEPFGIKVHILPFPKAIREFGDSGGVQVQKFFSLLLSFLWPIPFIKYYFKLKSIIHLIQPDLIHSNGMKTHVLGALTRPKKTPVIWHQHDFISNRPLLSKLLKLFSRNISVCICVSELVAEDAKKVPLKCKIQVIRNGIDTQHFAPGPKVGDDRFRIGLIATYARWKGQDVFIEAAAKVLERHPHHQIHFYIVGGPIYQTLGSQFSREELEHLVHKLGISENITFVPFEKDVLPIYHALDCVVHASTRPEPFGLTIAEAMSCGKTVIASSMAGALQPPFLPNQPAALICEPTSNAITDALTRILEDELFRNALKINARSYTEKYFDVAKMNDTLSRVYKTYLGS